MRLRINQGSVSLGGNTILDHFDLEIRGKEKIAIVGQNGVGKTTLLHLISGQIDLDSDDKNFDGGIWMARNTTIGILEQNPFFEKNLTVEEIIHEACPSQDIYSNESYQFEIEYNRIFTRFGFSLDEKKKKIDEFSGGEQTKIALIRLLLMKPDILLMDEPTNHLDIESIRWLEEYLKSYEKAVLLVSHDRYFLDQVVDVVYELCDRKTKRYAGNYTAYRDQRENELAILKKRYKEQQEEIDRINKLIDKFKHKPKKAAMTRSKKKILERMSLIENPDSYDSYLYPGQIIPNKMGSKSVFNCQKLVIGHEEALHQINLSIKRGQKIGIIGPNGVGKTTFLKTLAGQLNPISGNLIQGNNIEPSYYDQMTSEISSDVRLLEDFQKTFPSYSLGDCRKILAKFLFKKDEVGKTISNLSGGEKSRYTFAKLLENKPNLLMLDEPTNHLDIPSKEILESAFKNYSGTILVISHDRYFLKEVVNCLLIFEEGKVTYYPYGYERYVESLEKEKKRKLQGIHSMEEENAAFLQSFESIPEKKRMQSARFNEEQSYTDWQLDLITKELEKKAAAYRLIHETFPCNDIDLLKIYRTEYGFSEEEWSENMERLEQVKEDYEDCCIRWYEMWLQYEQAFENYYDA